MMNTLIIGYGNADRQDDGIAWYILCGLARRLGRAIPSAPEEGFFPEGQDVDLWFQLQLTPEMAEDIARYQRICFVDAHTGDIEQDILLQPVDNHSKPASAFTHHMTPAACMAIARTVYQRSPEAVLLSARGYAFDFARSLSPQAAALVDQAVDQLWDWCRETH